MKNQSNKPQSIFRRQTNWHNLYFYQKTDVLYRLTYYFCKKFFPKYGDRTVDQMIQAARSGKQNIAEGCSDGVTSIEMQLKLLNVARASIIELKEDYIDYLHTHSLSLWDANNPRYDAMLKFCREHNTPEEYEPLFERLSDAELANLAISLCHIVDRLMVNHMKKIEQDFTEKGGIRERMTSVRLGRRQSQVEEIDTLKARIAALEQENRTLKEQLAARG